MKIAPQSTDQFLRQPDKAVQAVLIYGPDAGLVSERIKALSSVIVPNINDPFSVVILPFEKLKEEPVLLADEMAAISFMGGRKLIRITDMPANLPAPLQATLENPPGDAFVIIEGDDLSVASSLRKFFEKHPHTAAIACYKDDAQTLGRIMEGHLRGQGYSFEPIVISYMQQHFFGDRLVVLSELEKLALYMGDNKHITLQDVIACVGESVESSLDTLCNACASANNRAIETSFERILKEGTPSIAMLRALLRHFSRLHYVKGLMTSGMNEQDAMAKLVPPVFFKQVPEFKSQLRNWSESRLLQMIRAITKAELEAKKTGSPADTICRQLLGVAALQAAEK